MDTDLCAVEEAVTVVLGASPVQDRYSNRAVRMLLQRHLPVVAIGNRVGTIEGLPVVREIPDDIKVDTVTLYLNPFNLQSWHARILGLKPRRIIFNPGTEDPAFMAEARKAGIEVVEGCTLVMLSTGTY